jgi:chemotaxis response regulator CheB
MTRSERDIVVIGSSAGGIGALKRLLQVLPSDLGASIFVVQHRPDFPETGQGGRDALAEVLSRGISLPIRSPDDGERFQRGHVYVAPPTRHLLIEGGLVRLEQSPKESRFRPSADALFRSAALEYGRRVIGVVLSGVLADGTAGLWQIRKRGGVTIAQDPAEAEHDEMVRSAISNVEIDFCLRAEDIGKKIVELCTPARAPESSCTKVLIVEDERIVAMNLSNQLAKLGYEVSGSVASAEAAFEIAGRTLPDVVLMDIHLEGPVRGTEAARRIWEKFQIPTVYVTAYSDDATLNDVKTTHPYGYILKPFRLKEIHAAIRLALDRRDRELSQGR